MFDINNSLGQKLTKLKRNTCFGQKWCLRAYFSHLLIILNGIFAVVGGPHRFQSASIVTFHRHALEVFTEAIMMPSAAAYPDCKTTPIRRPPWDLGRGSRNRRKILHNGSVRCNLQDRIFRFSKIVFFYFILINYANLCEKSDFLL